MSVGFDGISGVVVEILGVDFESRSQTWLQRVVSKVSKTSVNRDWRSLKQSGSDGC